MDDFAVVFDFCDVIDFEVGLSMASGDGVWGRSSIFRHSFKDMGMLDLMVPSSVLRLDFVNLVFFRDGGGLPSAERRLFLVLELERIWERDSLKEISGVNGHDLYWRPPGTRPERGPSGTRPTRSGPCTEYVLEDLRRMMDDRRKMNGERVDSFL